MSLSLGRYLIEMHYGTVLGMPPEPQNNPVVYLNTTLTQSQEQPWNGQ